MFDFEKLIVYKKSQDLHKEVNIFLKNNIFISRHISDQLKRAASSISLNIAEGSGKLSKADRRNFYTTARGSTYECVSILQILLDEEVLNTDQYKNFYQKYEEISKMLFRLIESQK